MHPPEQNEATFFERCLELSPEDRESFLESACSGDLALKDRILALLKAHDESEGFMHSLPREEGQQVIKELHRIAPSEEKPGDRIGRYRLMELIGEGSWGTVWRAEQVEDIERQVALKILKLGLDTKEFLARFEAERQTLALMDHPNIAQVLDAGATEYGRPYFVMELVRGVPIFEYADRERLTIKQRIALFIDVCHAIQHAHGKGVIHRDLKPSNILTAVHNDRPVAKVIDFGIAKTTQVRLSEKTLFTAFNSFVGTPVYSSPEQLAGNREEIDHRSDIYSLGALLYELVGGSMLFDSEALSRQGLEEVKRCVMEEEPLRPSQVYVSKDDSEKKSIASARDSTVSKLESQLKGDLDLIVLKCLEKSRTRRYDTVDALIQDLSNYLSGHPISAVAPSALYRFKKYITRKRPAYAIGLEIALAVVILLAVVLYFRPSPHVTPDQRGGGSSHASLSLLPEKSIAVLPLANLSPDPDNAFFADGVQEDILTNLSKIQDLLVISRSSTLQYRETDQNLREIGMELGARYLVEGSVRRAGDRIRITVQLIDTATDGHLWSKTYTQDLDDIFEIQAEVAEQIAGQLQAVLSPETLALIQRRPTENQEAYDLFIKARELGVATPNAYEALKLCERAVELDPEFAEAWAHMARCLIFIWRWDKFRNDPETLRKAHYVHDKAVLLAPSSG